MKLLTYRVPNVGRLSHGHHALHFGLIGEWFQLVHVNDLRLHHQGHRVRRELGYSAHEARMVLDFHPRYEGGALVLGAGNHRSAAL